MTALQTSYGERMARAYAGMMGNQRIFDGFTRVADGSIAFGVAVSQAAADTEKKCKQGGALIDFLGVSHKDITLEATRNDAFADGDNVGIIAQGPIWVSVTGTPGPDDPVHYDTTTGVFKASGGIGPVLGARWMTRTENGLCLLQLPAYGQATS